MDFQVNVLGDSFIDYNDAWDMQRTLHSQVVAGTAPDQVLLLEHAAVYTAGRRTEPFERPLDGTPVIDVDRGGKITWHGPGQLVGYPILHLPSVLDVVAHVRRLEDVIIGVCADFGLATVRIKGRSGVWVEGNPQDRKIAAIGVRVAQGVTMHGFAINCNNEQSWFDSIIPCGISDAGVTSLTQELGQNISPHDIIPSVTANLHRVFDSLVLPPTVAKSPASSPA